MRAALAVNHDADHRSPSSARLRSKSDSQRATGTGRQTGPAIVCLRKVLAAIARDRDAANLQSRLPRVRQHRFMRR